MRERMDVFDDRPLTIEKIDELMVEAHEMLRELEAGGQSAENSGKNETSANESAHKAPRLGRVAHGA